MNKILEEIYQYGIVPVVTITEIENAKPLARALCNGGLAVAEVTYRSDVAHDAIVAMKQECPSMLIGAGTILTIEQVDSAIEAGVAFIVSPGLNPKIVKYCIEKDIPIIPGCSSPSNIEQAIELGLTTVKFFPAEANGGINAIKAMAAPYGNIRFMPTGGVNERNLNEYLKFDKILACGGTWMASSDLIEQKQFDKIETLTRQAVSKMLNIKVAHVGINTKDETSNVADTLSKLTRTPKDERSASVFVGDMELMRDPNKGTLGHIAYSTSNIERCKFYLEKENFCFDQESATYDSLGNMKFIYTCEEVNGYAIHFVKENI